ncbi:hypothetical protein [Streptomyces alanosinicus]|uniref:Uncharacterized protein n=1 Tax=Streptomyces alanosinicus TaxID=68171 RepID=A0A918YPY5_9ACTN|nr:hypothetical protein GCM10010339_75220 [Streptomyces alanosinicus]
MATWTWSARALELTWQGTHITDQLADLVTQIAVINAFNRRNVITQQPAGDYEAGMLTKFH